MIVIADICPRHVTESVLSVATRGFLYNNDDVDPDRREVGRNMEIKFQVDIPLRERLAILWYGRVFVKADYRGQNEPLHIEIGAVNFKNLKPRGEPETRFTK